MREFRKRNWQMFPANLTWEKIREVLDSGPVLYRTSQNDRQVALLHLMVGGMMGPAWSAKHVFTRRQEDELPSKRYGFFELEFSNDVIRERKIARIIDFVEMLFNLQTVPGYAHVHRRLQSVHPKNFEGMYAELQIAKMLYATGYRFRFVRAEKQRKGEDYDFELMFPDGCVVCVEAKSRDEGQSVNPLAIASKLNKARRQLPKDAPGIILMKIPEHWYLTPGVADHLQQIAFAFLKNTKTIVSVKYYVSLVELDAERQITTHRHAYQEISNENTKFPERNWCIFAGNNHRPDWKWFTDLARIT